MFVLKQLLIISSAALIVSVPTLSSSQTATNLSPQFNGLPSHKPASPRVRFAVIGDRTGQHVQGVYEQAIAEVARLQPDFVLTVGDQIEGYTEDSATLASEWQEYFNIVKQLPVPLYIAPGNHDITTDGQLPMFKRFVGEPYRSFNVGDLHFVILDNSRWESSDQLPSEQLQWLASDLAAATNAKFTFVFFHKPFWYNSLALGKPDTLHTLFVKYGVDGVFTGHFHRYFSSTFDGIKYTGVGSSGGGIYPDPTGMEYHFIWVTVDSNIEITPIKLGAVKPWDVTTATELYRLDSIEQNAISFDKPVAVMESEPTGNLKFSVRVANFSADSAIADSIRWDSTAGWKIVPPVAALAVPPSGRTTVEFQAIATGALFPVPTLSAKLPFRPGQSATVYKYLAIARQAVCRLVSKPPVVDGRLTDEVWQRPISRLYNGDGAVIDSTFWYFAYDKQNLYVAVRCKESRPDSIVAAITERDGAIFGEDCIGYFFQPNLRKDTVYQVYFSPLATIFDQMISLRGSNDYSGDRRWNGTYEVKTTRTADGWDVEARIPLKQFGITAKSGDQWGLNFRRKQKRLNSGAEWQTPIDYNPKSFGVLSFE
jgi:hypothetical protein